MADDQDRKDTRVPAGKDTSFDLEGTEEMDRSVLLARLRADRQARGEFGAGDLRDTEQHDAVNEATRPTEPVRAKFEPTQHYTVPESLLEQTREVDDGAATTTFSLDSLLEFDAVVDMQGRIALPDSALRGKFGRGARIRVVAQVIDGE